MREEFVKRNQFFQKKVQQNRSSPVRLFYIGAMFFTYILIGIYDVVVLVFKPAQSSFQEFYQLHPNKGYQYSYSSHIKLQKKARVSISSVALIVVSIVATQGILSAYYASLADGPASVPNTPSISSPLNNSYNSALTLTITGSTYASTDGAAHLSSDWQIVTNSSDPSGTQVWASTGDTTNKTSVTIPGATLQNNTQYYTRVRYTNATGSSNYSSWIAFTTVYNYTTSTVNWNFNDNTQYSYNSSYVQVNNAGDGLASLIDQGSGVYANANWGTTFLSGWSYRKVLTVTNNTADALTNYQVRVTVPYAAQMQADFDDIRFTDSTGLTTLSYWLESKTNSSTATFWVKVPSISASGAATTYMYYGNASAVSASNKDDVFLYADDFSGTNALTARTGDFTSRVFDNGSSSTWNTLAWTPQFPAGKELPDSAGVETAYAESNVSMASNKLLLHLNETGSATSFADGSGQSHPGSCAGSSCPTPTTAGKFSGAMNFDGSNDYISVADSADWYFGASDFTVETWFKPNNTGANQQIVGQHNNGVNAAWILVYHGTSVTLYLSDGANTGTTFTFSNTFNTGQWYHYVAVRSSNRIYGYINGVLMNPGGTAYTSTLQDNVNPVTIGADNDGNGFLFSGAIDEVAIFKGRAFTATEALDHYKRGIVRLQFQARSCDDAACSGEAFVGSDNTNSTYFSEPNGTALPSVSLSGLAANRYVQYRAFLQADSSTYYPQLQSVTIAPSSGSNQTDNDNVSAGFSGGTHASTTWNAGTPQIKLQAVQTSGNWISSIIDATTTTSWNTFSPTTTFPTYKELPNSQGVETAYSSRNASMASNNLLMHFNEGAAASIFSDTSGTRSPGIALNVGATSGNFTSRIFDTGSSTAWNTLSYTNIYPLGKPLPDSDGVETGYSSGNANMTNNVLLLHLNESSGTISDTSGNSNTATATGGVTYSATAPFSTGVALNGSTGYITTPDSADYYFGSSNFTLETWVKLSSITGGAGTADRTGVMYQQDGGGNTNKWFFYLQEISSTQVQLGWHQNNTSAQSINTTGNTVTLVDGAWHHIAFTRSGSTGTFYVDGIAQGTVTMSYDVPNSGDELNLGRNEDHVGQMLNGTLDEAAIFRTALSADDILWHYRRGAATTKFQVRSCDDSSCSGESFTGPGGTTSATNSALDFDLADEAQFTQEDATNGTDFVDGEAMLHGTAVSAVKTLLHFNNNLTDFGSGGATWTNSNATYTSASAGKFNQALSVASGSYIQAAASANFDLGTNFIIEFWIKPTNIGTFGRLFSTRSGSGGYEISIGAAGDMSINHGSCSCNNGFGTTGTVTFGEWNHVALVSDGVNRYWYLNGVLDSVSSAVSTNSNGAVFRVGQSAQYNEPVTALIDDLKITKGDARYIAKFIPSRAAYSSDATTTLLQHADGTNGSQTFTDSSSNNHTITVTGNTQISTTNSVFGGSSAAFDGTGDDLRYDFSGDLGASDWTDKTFTVDFWMNLNTVAGNPVLFATQNASYNAGYPAFYFQNNGGTLQLGLSSNGSSWDIANLVSCGTVNANEWYHVALMYDNPNNRFAVYKNGVQECVFDNVTSLYNGTKYAISGSWWGSQFLNGYIDEMRVSIDAGTAAPRWRPTAITMPSTAVSSDGNTVLLLHTDGANNSTTFTDSSASAKTVTANGDAKISTTQSQFGGSSAVFDGTGDYLSLADSTDWNFGSGDFTVDFWMNTSSEANERDILFKTGSNTGSYPSALHITLGHSTASNWAGGGYIGVHSNYNGSSWGSQFAGVTHVADGAWHHIALTRSGTRLILYVDGRVDGMTNYSYTFPNYLVNIGGQGIGDRMYNGYLDDIRVTKGARQFSADFTPQTYRLMDNNTYPDTSSYYTTTGADNSISLASVTAISSLTINKTLPSGSTTIKGLVSFDGRSTWKYYSGGSWQTAAGGLNDLQTSGMTTTAIESAFTNWTKGSETSLDFAFDLASTDYTITPVIDSISIAYTQLLDATTTYYSESNNTGLTPQTFSLQTSPTLTPLANNRYFQYKTFFTTANTTASYLPEIQTISAVAGNGTYTDDANTGGEFDSGTQSSTRLRDTFNVANPPAANQTGKLSGAVKFDGTNDQIIVPSKFPFHDSGDKTIEFWVKLASNNVDDRIIWSREDTTDANRYNLSVMSGLLYLDYRAPDATQHTLISASSVSLTDLAWHHIVITRSGNTYTVYKDGVSTQTGTDSSPSLPTYDKGWLMGGNNTFIFDGYLDEFSIYDRALSSAEALDRYLRGAAKLQYQLRSCDDAACDVETFLGPDGTAGTYYDELSNSSINVPTFTISNQPNPTNRYLQYKAFFNTDTSSYSPALATTSTVAGNGTYAHNDIGATELGGGTHSSTYLYDPTWLTIGDSATSWTELTNGGASVGTFAGGAWTKACDGECDWTSGSALDAGIYRAQPSGSWEAITSLTAATSSGDRRLGMMLYNSTTSGYMWGYNPASSSFQLDSETTANLCSIGSASVPAFLKIQKTTTGAAADSNSFKFFSSSDGNTWSQCGAYTATGVMGSYGLGIEDATTGATSATYDNFLVKQYITSEPTVSLGSQLQQPYTYANVSVTAALGNTTQYSNLFSIAQTLGGSNAGSVKYQIGLDTANDGVDTWYYHNGTTWTAVTTDSTDNDTITEVNAFLPAFPTQVAAGRLYLKAFLISDGSQQVQLDNVAAQYTNTPTFTGTIGNQTTNEDTNISNAFDLDTYFADPDGDALTYSLSNDLTASLGTVSIGAGNVVSFTVAANATGTDTIQFRATDTANASVTSNTITVTINAVNDTPTFTGTIGNQTTNEDTNISNAFDLDTYFADPDGDALTYSLSNDLTASLGTVSIGAGNVVTFTVATGASGTDTIQFRATDPSLATADSNTITVTITAVNDTPTFTGTISNITTPEDTNVTNAFDLDTYFADQDNDTLSYSMVNELTASLGTITINADNTVTLTVAANATGTDTIQFRATDPSSTTADSNTITVTINAVNDTPTFTGTIPDQAVNPSATSTAVFDLDTYFADVDSGDTCTFSKPNDFSLGTLTIQAGNTVDIAAGGTAGTDTVQFRCTDVSSATVNSNVITITVDTAPTFIGTIANQVLTPNQTSTAVFDLDTYFADADAGDTCTFTKPNDFSLGTITIQAGNIVDIAAGVTPGTDTVQFRCTDTFGRTVDSNSITINVNTAPTFTGSIANQTLTVSTTSAAAFDLDTYFADVDAGDTCTFSKPNDFALGTLTIQAGNTVDIAAGATAGTDIIQFRCTDARGATIDSNSITITVNRVPTFTGTISNITTPEDTNVTNAFDLDTYFTDPDNDTLTYSVTNNLDPALGTLTINSDNTVTLTVVANATGTDTIQFRATDTSNATASSNAVTVTITTANDTPTFSGTVPNQTMNVATTRTAAFDLDTYFTDVDTGDTCTYSVVDSFALGSIAIQSNGTVDFQSDAEVGSDIVQFRCTDAQGAAVSSNVVTIVVNAVIPSSSTPPGEVLTPRLISNLNDKFLYTSSILAYAFDLSSYFASSAISVAATESYVYSVDDGFSLGTMNVAGNGVVTFIASGVTGEDTVQFRATNSYGQSAVSNLVVIRVVSTNQTPTFSGTIPDQSIAINTTQASAINLSHYFSDPDTAGFGDYCTYTAVNGLLSSLGVLTISSTGVVDITSQSTVGADTVQIRCTDGLGARVSSNTFTVTITPEAQSSSGTNPPTLLSSIANQSTNEDVTLTAAFDLDDYFSHYTSTDACNYSVVDAFDQGAVTIDQGVVSIIPTANASGVDTIKFRCTDSGGYANTNSIRVTVNAINDAPQFIGTLDDVSFVAGNTTSTVFDLDDYFSDVDDTTLTYSVSGNEHVLATIVDGQVQFSASTAFSGAEALTFKAFDSSNAEAQSNEIVVIVTEPSDDGGDDNEDDNNTGVKVSHVTGTWRHKGIISVIGTDGSVLYRWLAFHEGGVVPRLIRYRGTYYVFAVKRRSGSTIHVYGIQGNTLKKKKVSEILHWRKMTVGLLDSNKKTIEMITATKRGQTVYFKIYGYHIIKHTLGQLPVYKKYHHHTIKRKFMIALHNKTIRLRPYRHGKLLLRWKPFKYNSR